MALRHNEDVAISLKRVQAALFSWANNSQWREKEKLQSLGREHQRDFATRAIVPDMDEWIAHVQRRSGSEKEQGRPRISKS